MGQRIFHQRRILAAAVTAGVMLSIVACASLTGIDKLAIGECKGGGECKDGGDKTPDNPDPPYTPGGGDEDVQQVVPAECPMGKGPTMVKVGTTSNPFCIDSTEVTVGQYKEFIASAPSPGSQDAECAWNTDFNADTGGAADNLPRVQVDWCDAVAYCKWAGKRICGKLVDGKPTGTKLAKSDLGSATVDQWYMACSNNGDKDYPYGPTFKTGACNLNVTGPKSLTTAGAFPECIGGTDGIFDMLGNTWEWIDYCVDVDAGGGPEKYICFLRGGSYGAAEQDAKCDWNATIAPRYAKNEQTGIRCCSP